MKAAFFFFPYKYYGYIPHFKSSISLCASQHQKNDQETRMTCKAGSVSASSMSCLSHFYQSLQVAQKPFFTVLLIQLSLCDVLAILIIHTLSSLLFYVKHSKSFSTSVSAKESSFSWKRVLLSGSRAELMRCMSSHQHPKKAVNNFWQASPLNRFYLK